MTPLDKEVAEWMEGLGFSRYDFGSGVWFDPVGLQPNIDNIIATFFYTTFKQSELTKKVQERQHEFDAISGVRYQNTTLDAVNRVALNRLSQAQVDLQLFDESLEAQLIQTKLESKENGKS